MLQFAWLLLTTTINHLQAVWRLASMLLHLLPLSSTFQLTRHTRTHPVKGKGGHFQDRSSASILGRHTNTVHHRRTVAHASHAIPNSCKDSGPALFAPGTLVRDGATIEPTMVIVETENWSPKPVTQEITRTTFLTCPVLVNHFFQGAAPYKVPYWWCATPWCLFANVCVCARAKVPIIHEWTNTMVFFLCAAGSCPSHRSSG